MEPILTTDQLAARWQRPRDWVAQQAKQGVIPGAFRLGRRWRFRLDDIETYETNIAAPGEFALSPGAAARRRAA